MTTPTHQCPQCSLDLTSVDTPYKYNLENPKYEKEIKLFPLDYIEKTENKEIEKALAKTVGWWTWMRIRKLLKESRGDEAKQLVLDLCVEVCYQLREGKFQNVYIFKNHKPIFKLRFEHFDYFK